MKFVVLSDTHCRHRSIKLPPGEVLLHAGDITMRGELSEVEDFFSWFRRQPFRHKIFIAGNHDFFFEKAAPQKVQALIPEGIHYLNDSGISINGINIWGSPITPWFYNWAFNKPRGPELRKHWQKIPAGTQVLVTHGPSFGILDTVLNGKHAGCRDLLQRIREVQPKVHVFGHIHESYGATSKDGIRYFNASILNENYELVNKPLVFEV